MLANLRDFNLNLTRVIGIGVFDNVVEHLCQNNLDRAALIWVKRVERKVVQQILQSLAHRKWLCLNKPAKTGVWKTGVWVPRHRGDSLFTQHAAFPREDCREW
jgi:hypothetical protein